MSKAALMTIAALAMQSEFGTAHYQMKAPKNKYNLTPEEIEQMKSMTPKEKKLFLRNRKNSALAAQEEGK